MTGDFSLNMRCPECGTGIRGEDVNVKTDLAKCLNCLHVFVFSERFFESHLGKDRGSQIESIAAVDLNNPPKGCRIHRQGSETVITASTRQPIAFFLIPFMLVWSGGSLGGLYGSQIIRGEFDLLLSIFGIPFLLGSAIFWYFTFMTLGGHVKIHISGNSVRIFSGIARIGKRFTLGRHEIRSLVSVSNGKSGPGQGGYVIRAETDSGKYINFGGFLPTDRRFFIIRALQKELAIA